MYENDASCSLNHSLNLSPMNPGFVILEYARAIREGKSPLMKKPDKFVDLWCQLTSFFGQVMSLNLDLTNSGDPRIVTLPPQACMIGTRHEGCITSSVSLLTLMGPSL